MGKTPDPEAAAAIEQALRDAFAGKAAEPVPESLLDHIDRLTGEEPETGAE